MWPCVCGKMSDNAEKLAQFKAVTGTNDERARFFLDSATGNLEVSSCFVIYNVFSYCEILFIVFADV